MATTLAFSELNAWLGNQAENTKDTPYEIVITGVTDSDLVGGDTTPINIQKILTDNSTKYVSIIGLEGEVTTIGKYAFQSCSSLTSITIPDSVTKIGNAAFYSCASLTSVTILDNITRVGLIPFENSPIEIVTIGKTIETKSLANLEIPIDSLTTVRILDNVTSIIYGFGDYNNLSTIIVDENNTVLDSRNNCNAIIETSTNKLIAGCKDTVIPNSVTSIGDSAFDSCRSLTSITIPNSVTSIGDAAFQNCDSLTSINIPDSVTSIGTEVSSLTGGVFQSCESLTNVTIGNGVTYIGSKVFAYCTSLNLITILGNPTIESNSFSGLTTNIKVNPEVWTQGYSSTLGGATSVTFYDLDGNPIITPTTLNAYLASLPENSVDNPYEIKIFEVTNDDLKGSSTSGTVGNILNANSTKYVSIIGLEGEVTYIGDKAFYNCTSLTSITIPDSVTSIGYYAFSSCTGLASIIVSEGNTTYDSRNNCNAVIKKSNSQLILGCKNTVIPNSVTSIGYGAFYGCTSLTSITIPDSVTSIGTSAFQGCSGLSEITIPDSVTYISLSAFSDCTSLTEITIPDSITYLAGGAFGGCTNIKTIYIGKAIEFSSFGNKGTICLPSLETVVWTSNPTSIKSYAFTNCPALKNITIPNTVTSIGQRAFSGCSSITSITIPDGVTTIGQTAFSDCTGLTSITIPSTVTTIGGEAFYGCSLTSITIPNSVETVGTNAFKSCPIETVTIGKIIETKTLGDISIDKSNITDITVLDGVTSLVSSAFSSSYNLLNVTLPEGLETIGASAFRKCMPLPTITIPSTVTTIGSQAFLDCTSMDPITILGNTEFANDSLIGLTLNVKVNPEVWTQGYTSSLGGGAVIFYDLDGNLLSPITPSTLDTFLYLAPINSADTPYEITLTNVTNTDLVGNATTPVHIQKAIKDNSTKYLKIVGIEGEVTTIGEAAFAGCTNLLGLAIPNTITTIGEGAFCETGMESIVIPGSVTSMDCYYLFADCLSLKNVTFNNGEISPTRTEGMFQNDTELDTINLIWLNTENLTDTSKYENMFAGITADVYVSKYIWGLGTDDATFGGATAITWHKITLELDIVDGIENEDVYYGIVKTLRVNAIANLPSTTITYKWYKNNLLMETVTGNSYTYVVLEDGTYKCEVTATLGDDTVTKYTEGTIKAVPYYEEGTKVIVHGSQTIRSDLYVHGEIKGTFMDSIIARIEALENRD